jgi:hypothetical protein
MYTYINFQYPSSHKEKALAKGTVLVFSSRIVSGSSRNKNRKERIEKHFPTIREIEAMRLQKI